MAKVGVLVCRKKAEYSKAPGFYLGAAFPPDLALLTSIQKNSMSKIVNL